MKNVFGILTLLLLVYCQPSLSRTDRAMRNLERNATQLRASQNAGNLDTYVGAIINAYSAKVDEKGTELQRRKLVDSKNAALGLLDKQVQASPAEAHYLLARKGTLYLYASEVDKAEVALRESYDLKPNIGAARYLIFYLAKRNNQIAMSSMCQEAVMTTEDGSEQYTFITQCRDATGAATEEGKMAWANPQIKDFYKTESTRRQKIEKENRRQAAIARVAEQERQAEIQRHQKKVSANKKICEAICEENGAYCKRPCGSDVGCKNTCIDAQNACYQKCYAISERDR